MSKSLIGKVALVTGKYIKKRYTKNYLNATENEITIIFKEQLGVLVKELACN